MVDSETKGRFAIDADGYDAGLEPRAPGSRDDDPAVDGARTARHTTVGGRGKIARLREATR